MVHLIKHESLPLVVGIVVLCGLYVLAMKLTAPKAEAAKPRKINVQAK